MIKILVVDDNQINLITLKNQLKRLGFKADTAIDGASALSLYKEQTYAVVLLDFYLPDMSGAELGHKIKALDANQHHQTHLFSISADSQAQNSQAFTGLEIVEYLQKPVTQQALSAALSPWMADERPKATHVAGIPVSKSLNLDWKKLNRWLPSSRDDIVEFINEFSQTNTDGIIRMNKALQQKDYTAVAKEAHHLQAPPKAFGMNRFSGILEQIQSAASLQINPESLLNLLESLKQCQQGIDTDLNKMLSKLE